MDDPPATPAPPSPPAGPGRADLHPDDLPPAPRTGFVLPRGVVWAGVLFVVVLAVASWRALSTDPAARTDDVVHLDQNAPPPSNGLVGIDIVGQAAPRADFITFDGRHASLAELAGKPIVINFWASSCAPCVTEMPEFEKVHQRYGDRVAFLGIDTVDGETPARALASRTGVTYELGFDPDGAIAKTFGVVNLPTTILIDRNGTVVFSNFGARNADELTKQIEEHLAP